MSIYKKFDINDPIQVSILGYAMELALDETLENAAIYLEERFEIAPLKALKALHASALGFKLTPLQLQYVTAYIKAEQFHINNMNEKLNEIESK